MVGILKKVKTQMKTNIKTSKKPQKRRNKRGTGIEIVLVFVDMPQRR